MSWLRVRVGRSGFRFSCRVCFQSSMCLLMLLRMLPLLSFCFVVWQVLGFQFYFCRGRHRPPNLPPRRDLTYCVMTTSFRSSARDSRQISSSALTQTAAFRRKLITERSACKTVCVCVCTCAFVIAQWTLWRLRLCRGHHQRRLVAAAGRAARAASPLCLRLLEVRV